MNKNLSKGSPSPDIRVGEIFGEYFEELLDMRSKNGNKFGFVEVKLLQLF